MAFIYLALVLVALMIFAAFAVDIGLARQDKAQTQAAVDSAALSGAQVIDTTKASQSTAVYDHAAATVLKTMNAYTGALPARQATCGGGCYEYQQPQGGATYDVQVTTPFIGPGESVADKTLLNVKTCWGVPTIFGGVIGWKTIPLCASATAQNGTGTGGPTNGGCGTATDEFTNVTNTFNKPVGQQTIAATYSSTYPLDTNNVHFVVQTQYGNFAQIPSGAGTNYTYKMTDNSGGALTNVTFSYTLPNTIDTSPAFHYSGGGTIGTGAIYSNTFTANLQVIDQLGRQCGDASWTTCNPPKSSGAEAHDPVLDGGAGADGINGGYGLGNNGAETFDDNGNETEKSPTGDNSNISGDGHDVTSDEYVQTRNPQTNPVGDTNTPGDDTITPPLGNVVSAGWPVGAIYNDEQALDAAWTYFIVDGVQKQYSSTFTNDTYTFTDPSTVWQYPPAGATVPSPINSVPQFGIVDNTVSTYTKSGNTLKFTILDNMGNPMPGLNVTIAGSAGTGAVTPPASTVTALDGTLAAYSFANTPNGTYTYTVSYSLAANAPQWGGPLYPGGSLAQESGSFPLTIKWTSNSLAVTGGMNSVAAANWPNAQHDQPASGSKPGGSVGVMYDSGVLQNGWHSAILFVNDGDRTTSGGDCGLATWVFSTTGGLPGPGTLHLIS